MSTAIPAEVAEHVSMDDNGNLILSELAQQVMEGVEPPQLEEEAAPEQAATPAEPVPATPASKTIKWNGQEVEIPADKEVEFLQKGYNYEQKMAQLEQERAKVAAYSGLVSAIESSPDIRAKVSEALGYKTAEPQPQQPVFDDPIEQLKWETRQEVLKEVQEKFFAPLTQQQQLMQHKLHIESVRQQVQSDPQFSEVQTAIIEQIKSLPEAIGKELYAKLDQDPAAYMEMFNTTKARLKPAATNTTNLPQKASDTPPQPTKRETKAPLLESGDTAPPDTAAQQQMQERIKELTRKSKNGDYRAIGELMQLMA